MLQDLRKRFKETYGEALDTAGVNTGGVTAYTPPPSGTAAAAECHNSCSCRRPTTRHLYREQELTNLARDPGPTLHRCTKRRLSEKRTGKVVGPDRLELSTSVLSGLRSNHLSYGPTGEEGPWVTLARSIFWGPPHCQRIRDCPCPRFGNATSGSPCTQLSAAHGVKGIGQTGEAP